MNRSNDTWVEQLARPGTARDGALTDLQTMLFSRLSAALEGRAGVDAALLEDIVQESLMKTLDHLDTFRGKSQFVTWATAIAIRTAFSELRRKHWKDVSLEQLTAGSSTYSVSEDSASPSPATIVERTTLHQELYHVIDTELTDKQRTVLLAELKGMPTEEIARQMGSTRNAIYKLAHDARKRLKQHLEAAGYSVADLQTA